MSRVFRALRLSLTKRSQELQRAVSYKSSHPINEHGNMAKMAPGKMDANAPMKWFMPVQFAGLGGFWPTSLTPLVAFFAALLAKFLYENMYGQDTYDGQIAEMKKEYGMNLYRVCF